MPLRYDQTILPLEPNPQETVSIAAPSSSYLHFGEPSRRDITFHTSNQTETLRIADNGDFLIQGRLVQNDLEIYQAFRKFLGLPYAEPAPKPRVEVETRYQRICKKFSEGQ